MCVCDVQVFICTTPVSLNSSKTEVSPDFVPIPPSPCLVRTGNELTGSQVSGNRKRVQVSSVCVCVCVCVCV